MFLNKKIILIKLTFIILLFVYSKNIIALNYLTKTSINTEVYSTTNKFLKNTNISLENKITLNNNSINSFITTQPQKYYLLFEHRFDYFFINTGYSYLNIYYTDYSEIFKEFFSLINTDFNFGLGTTIQQLKDIEIKTVLGISINKEIFFITNFCYNNINFNVSLYRKNNEEKKIFNQKFTTTLYIIQSFFQYKTDDITILSSFKSYMEAPYYINNQKTSSYNSYNLANSYTDNRAGSEMLISFYKSDDIQTYYQLGIAGANISVYNKNSIYPETNILPTSIILFNTGIKHYYHNYIINILLAYEKSTNNIFNISQKDNTNKRLKFNIELSTFYPNSED